MKKVIAIALAVLAISGMILWNARQNAQSPKMLNILIVLFVSLYAGTKEIMKRRKQMREFDRDLAGKEQEQICYNDFGKPGLQGGNK